MSHQSKIATELRDKRSVVKALKKMGFKVTENARWKVYLGESKEKADIVGSHPDCPWDLALQKGKDGKYTISTDLDYLPWDMRDSKHHRMSDLIGVGGSKLVQQTSAFSVIDRVQDQGYQVDQTTERDGTLVLTCTLYEG